MKAVVLARFEGQLRAADDAAIDPAELLAALNCGAPGDDARRQAIACFLSGGQGWRDAAARLTGAFADRIEPASGLMRGKEK